MDTIVEAIAEYADELQFSDLTAEAVHHCKRCVVDTFGVALGAYDTEPSRIARALAQRAYLTAGARVIGSADRVLPELAAFANGVMVRYLDANDSFLGGGGHPSDCISTIFATADSVGADGRSICTAIVLAYEIYYNLWKSTPIRQRGIDNPFFPGVAGALGAAKVLGLNRAQIAHTLSLAITPNIPLDATRYGLLSMWKGCASGNAARNGVFAALLAAAGMTGPEKPIEGKHGLHRLIGEFQLLPFAHNGDKYAITRVMIKNFASVAHAMSPITVALELSRDCNPDEIKSVIVNTYQYAWEINGREPEKWRPTTREAADHSLPYIVAAVLLGGEFNLDIFSEERLGDPRIRTLIDKVEIKVDPEFSSRFPKQVPCRIEIEYQNGFRKVAVTDYPRGHEMNPMTDNEVNAKFCGYARDILPPERLQTSLDAMWSIDTALNLDGIFNALTP